MSVVNLPSVEKFILVCATSILQSKSYHPCQLIRLLLLNLPLLIHLLLQMHPWIFAIEVITDKPVFAGSADLPQPVSVDTTNPAASNNANAFFIKSSSIINFR